MEEITRTQEEISSYIEHKNDHFGWTVEILLPYLDYEHAKPSREATGVEERIVPATTQMGQGDD